MKHCDYRQSGATLIEITMVIVIIGVLIGSVMATMNLMRGAKIKATVSQLLEINIAKNAFRDKYFGYPGDLINAKSFWPAASNGDGDAIITCTGGSSHPDDQCYSGERSQFFYQLGLSGFLRSYTTAATLGQGYPAVAITPTSGMIVTGAWIGNPTGSNMGIENHAKDSMYLYLGVCAPKYLGSSSAFNDCGVFVPYVAQQIDDKLDDGNPGTGAILAHSYASNICTVSNLDQAYNLPLKTNVCNLFFSLAQ